MCRHAIASLVACSRKAYLPKVPLSGTSLGFFKYSSGACAFMQRHSIVGATAAARADASGGQWDPTMARWCEEEVVVGGDPCLS